VLPAWLKSNTHEPESWNDTTPPEIEQMVDDVLSTVIATVRVADDVAVGV
jgi:hypothetical protein